MLDEQDDLVFEFQELQLEMEENSRTLDNLCNLLERNNEKLRKLKEMNHRTPSKPQAICMVSPHNSKLEYLDEQTVIVNGVKYRRVEEPKPPTLYEVLYERGNMYSSVCDTVVEIVKEWMPDEVEVDTEEYNAGWNACIKHLRERLK